VTPSDADCEALYGSFDDMTTQNNSVDLFDVDALIRGILSASILVDDDEDDLRALPDCHCY